MAKKKNSILVIDDNANNLKLLNTVLAKCGYVVRLATSGQMALNSCASSPPDLILLDITMPGMDGFEVCRRIKNDPAAHDIPVIFLSALKEEGDIVQGYEVGGVDFVTKPFNAKVLKSRVQTHLTINRLQRNLKNINELQTDLIDERTSELRKSNDSLKSEIRQHLTTQHKRMLSEERLNYALQASNEGILDWDVSRAVILRSEVSYSMLGLPVEKSSESSRSYLRMIQQEDRKECFINIRQLIFGEKEKTSVRVRMKMLGGDYSWILLKGMVVERGGDGRAIRIVGTQTDISLEMEYQKHLKVLASIDSLTNLPNREFFMQQLTKTIKSAKRSRESHALLFLDLDRFKNINDSLGHTVGDYLLKSVAQRISDTLRGSDTVARLGGDEFTILLEGVSSPHRAAEGSLRIIEALSRPFTLDQHQVVITPSIGIVLFPEHGITPEELLRNADTAMYHCKSMGGNNFWFYTESLNIEARKRLELEESIRHGLDADEFFLHYQPQVDFRTGEIIGLEALCRWNRADGDIVPPDVFIPAAEETGLIIQLSEDIIGKAAIDAKRLSSDHGIMTKIAINISPRHFRHSNLLDYLKSTLESYDILPQQIEIEITEVAAMDNVIEAIDTMRAIKDTGITISIDDFGTGFSSLSYLRTFPIDTLKIDRSFITAMKKSPANKSIVRAIVDLAHTLNLKVVAEGVETRSQLAELARMECDYIQGYIYSRPVDIDQAIALIKHPNAKWYKFEEEP